jgi:hypothetical protein
LLHNSLTHPMSKQVSQYDKILRENLEAIIPGLLENVLGIVPIASEELPDAQNVGPGTTHKGAQA